MDFDHVLDLIGDFGKYQKLLYFLASIVSLLTGVHMLANVFTMAIPLHRCFVRACDYESSSFNQPWTNYTNFESCQLYARLENVTNASSTCSQSDFGKKTFFCSSWKYDQSEHGSTTVTEWDMICGESWTVSTSQSIFMAGNLIGSLIFGTLGDKYGRRLIFQVTPLVWTVTAVATAFAQDWVTFTILKLISSAAISGIFTTTFVVVVEFIGASKRAWCGNVVQITFALGELLLAALSYWVRDWRHLQLVISLPLFLLLSYSFLIPESVRWQLSKGQYTEAKSTIIRASRWNKKCVSYEVLDELVETAARKSVSKEADAGFCKLLKSPVLLRRSLNIFFNWMVNSLVYYGLSMSASNLGGNAHMNFAALAFVEIPAILVATVIQQKYGRRFILCFVMVIGGLSCIGAAFIPDNLNWLKTILAVFGKSNIAASFSVIYIYSAEIFPTSLRTTGIGISSTFSRVGGIVAPVVADLGNLSPALPMFIFGGTSIAAGLMALALPETHNQKLPETVSEAERFGRNQNLFEDYDDLDEISDPLLIDDSDS